MDFKRSQFCNQWDEGEHFCCFQKGVNSFYSLFSYYFFKPRGIKILHIIQINISFIHRTSTCTAWNKKIGRPTWVSVKTITVIVLSWWSRCWWIACLPCPFPIFKHALSDATLGVESNHSGKGTRNLYEYRRGTWEILWFYPLPQAAFHYAAITKNRAYTLQQLVPNFHQYNIYVWPPKWTFAFLGGQDYQ